MNPTIPLATIQAGIAGWRMMVEAQTVIAYRMLGMAGIWATDSTENSVMISEKGPALWSAQVAATNAMLRGARPDEVFSAWVKPIGHKTRANASRLAKRGLR